MFTVSSYCFDLRGFLLAAVQGDLAAIKSYLEYRQIPVDLTYEGKPSALSYAAMRGHSTLVNYLLRHAADVNYSDLLGQTPLIYATLGNHPNILTILLSHGANLYHQNQLGETALTLALRKPSLYPCAEILAQPEAAFFPAKPQQLH
jgi:ankyrin repeat protein